MSLYPSIMLAFKTAPAKDSAGVFLGLLATLRDFRLRAKASMKRAATPHERDEWNALQVAFKVLINSFYGYLGTSRHHFSDLRRPPRTERGREILSMVEWLKARGRILELDTDGIYFQPAAPLADGEGFVRELSATLPEGIEVEYDGDFAAMFSYKKKNYALLGRDGKMTVKGSGLKSRGLERFQRDHAARCCAPLEGSAAADADRLAADRRARIETGGWRHPTSPSRDAHRQPRTLPPQDRGGKRNAPPPELPSPPGATSARATRWSGMSPARRRPCARSRVRNSPPTSTPPAPTTTSPSTSTNSPSSTKSSHPSSPERGRQHPTARTGRGVFFRTWFRTWFHS
jgi:hypothetical protein